MNRLSLWLVLTAAAVAPATVDAATIKFCVKHTGIYQDGGVGEDYWPTKQARPAYGAWTEVRKGSQQGQLIWSGYLGDGIGAGDPGPGCTTNLYVSLPNATYYLNVGSYGVVDGNQVESWNGVFPTQGQWVMYGVTGSITIADGGALYTYWVTPSIPPATPMWRVFNQYLTAAFSVAQSSGIASGQLFKVVLTDTETPGYHGDSGIVFLANANGNDNKAWSNFKFLALHEVGHRFWHVATGTSPGPIQNYGVFDTACPVDLPAGSTGDANGDGLEDAPGANMHGIRSLEWAGAGVGEGFANFYAANAWNDASQDDCWFKYFIGVSCPSGLCLTVNCEAANTVFLRKLMHARPCTAPPGGLYVSEGNELDWLRAFWDLRTNSHANGTPSLAQIMAWITDSAAQGGWDADSAYDVLDARAQLQAANLRDLWNSTRESTEGALCGGDCNALEP